MINIVYTVTGTPQEAAEQAAEFYQALPDNMKGNVVKPVIAQAGSNQERELRDKYQAKFGERFRLLDNQAGQDVSDIIQSCLEAGKINKVLHGGKGASGKSDSVKGETFDGEIDLEEPPED
jgi:coenzyme F420-reducing hydrogenase beta subunit